MAAWDDLAGRESGLFLPGVADEVLLTCSSVLWLIGEGVDASTFSQAVKPRVPELAVMDSVRIFTVPNLSAFHAGDASPRGLEYMEETLWLVDTAHAA
jgi:hypothetical protein